MDDSRALLQAVALQGAEYTLTTEDAARKALIRTVRKLGFALETPIETTIRLAWADRGLEACLQTGIKLRLFDKLSLKEPKSCIQLANETNSDPKLLKRILKHLAAMDYLNETAPDTYTHTKYSHSLTNPHISDVFPLYAETVDPTMMRMPEFLEKNDFQDPSDPTNGPFQYGLNTKDTFFDILAKRPSLAGMFNNLMQGYVIGRKRWIDDGCYPVHENLINGMKPDRTLLVDIGGGTGRDINAFHSKFGGKCVLQDLPHVIQVAIPVDGVEVQEHDMFNPQPIKGARAYYMHSVLHDWPTFKCIEALKNISAVMTKGYSKVLINENVIPSLNAYWMTTGLDFIMMSAFASAERTEEDWHQLLEAAGLKITQIYTYELGTESLIEAELI